MLVAVLVFETQLFVLSPNGSTNYTDFVSAFRWKIKPDADCEVGGTGLSSTSDSFPEIMGIIVPSFETTI